MRNTKVRVDLFLFKTAWSTSMSRTALLWHKDTAQGTQSPLLGAFLAFHSGPVCFPAIFKSQIKDIKISPSNSCPGDIAPVLPSCWACRTPSQAAALRTSTGRDISRLCSHWSSSYITALSLVESFKVLKYFHSDATPALLCHKEPAQGTQSPLMISTSSEPHCPKEDLQQAR